MAWDHLFVLKQIVKFAGVTYMFMTEQGCVRWFW